MSKNEIRRYIILAVVFTVFSVISFAAPFTRNPVFWLSYVFGVIAVIMQVYVFRISFANGADTKSKYYGFPIVRVGVLYLIIQLALSIMQMSLANHIKGWISVIVNILPIAFAVIGMVGADAAREEVERLEFQMNKDVSLMKTLKTTSAYLPSIVDDPDLKKKLEQVAENIRFSDPVSTSETIPLEEELSAQLNALRQDLEEGKTDGADRRCDRILMRITERNQISKSSK